MSDPTTATADDSPRGQPEQDRARVSALLYGTTTDGTTWPIPDGDMEWALRYTTFTPSPPERLWLASVLAAYRHLTDPSQPMTRAQATLRRARAARLDDHGSDLAAYEQYLDEAVQQRLEQGRG